MVGGVSEFLALGSVGGAAPASTPPPVTCRGWAACLLVPSLLPDDAD